MKKWLRSRYRGLMRRLFGMKVVCPECGADITKLALRYQCVRCPNDHIFEVWKGKVVR